jgi:hypothetical protein
MNKPRLERVLVSPESEFAMPLPSGPKAEKIGFLLTRVIVPLWVMSGALMKLVEKSPKLLPKNIWTNALEQGVDLYILLFVLISLEFFAIAVMFFLPRFARFMAIWMLGAFCLILIGEILAGNTACGCLGAYSPSPYAMLAIDATLLILVLLFRPPSYEVGWLPKSNLIVAALFTVIATVVTGVIILSQRAPEPAPPVVVDGAPDGGTEAVTPVPGPVRPAYFGLPDTQSLAGQRFRDTELAGLIEGLTADIEMGPQYVILFSRSCEHCQELLETHVGGPTAVPLTLVAIPEAKEGFDESSWLDMNYCVDCATQLEMATGVDYLITPPLLIALAEGEVVCVAEVSDAVAPECLVFGL